MFVYVITNSINRSFYKGLSKDIAIRLTQHNAGKVRSTKAFKPWTLVYFEKCENLHAARIREKYLKSGIGREYLKKVISNSTYLPIEGPVVQWIE